MLLFDDTKKLEKAIGEEATGIIVRILEAQDEAVRKDLATRADLEREAFALKADLERMKLELATDIVRVNAETKSDILKWTAGLMLAQSAVIAALVKLL